MSELFHKIAFACLAALWAVLWVPLTILFVTVYVPAKAVPCMVRRADPKEALITALFAAWPVWTALLTLE